MNLSKTFEAVACKQLAACDLPRKHSHQHELTGVLPLRAVLGTATKIHGKVLWAFFGELQSPLFEENKFTFYDARAKSALRTGRSEWRFYYHGEFLAHAAIGDLLIFAKTKRRSFEALILPKISQAHSEAAKLFKPKGTPAFELVPFEFLKDQEWNKSVTPMLANWFGVS